MVITKLDQVLPLSDEVLSDAAATDILPPLKCQASVRDSLFKESILETHADAPSPAPAPPPAPKRLKLVVFLTFLLVLLSLGLAPSAYFAIQGSDLSFQNYMNSLSREHRKEAIEELSKKYFTPLIGTSQTPDIDNEINFLRSRTTFPIFEGMAYSPRNSMEPSCGFTQRDALLDVALLSSMTRKIRTYGMQCNQARYLLNAIKQLDVNMTLAMGVWLGPSEAINTSQLDEMKAVLKDYPAHLFECIFVGNEVLFRQDMSEDKLLSYVKDVKRFLAENGEMGRIPVGASEIGSLVSEKFLLVADIVGVNVHPFFGGEPVEKAGQWVVDYMQQQIEPKNKLNHKIAITEVGWPYSGGEYNQAVANATNFQKFLDSWVCEDAKKLRGAYDWYYFEAFDEPWKKIFYEENRKWETEWGLFGPHRNVKQNVTFPLCQAIYK